MDHKFHLADLVSTFEEYFKKDHKEIVSHGAMNPIIEKTLEEKILPLRNHRRMNDCYSEIGAHSYSDVYYAIIKAKTYQDEIKVRRRFSVVVPVKRMTSILTNHKELVNAGFEMGDHKCDPLKYCDIFLFNIIYNGHKTAENIADKAAEKSYKI